MDDSDRLVDKSSPVVGTFKIEIGLNALMVRFLAAQLNPVSQSIDNKHASVKSKDAHIWSAVGHSGDHQMNKLGASEVWNVARVNESYDIAYEPTTIEL